MILKELFLKLYTDPFDEKTSIYIQPSKEEIERCLSFGDYRFIADSKTKKLYAFNGEITHFDICEELGIDYDISNTRYMFGIAGSIKNGIAYNFSNDMFTSVLVDKKNIDEEWAMYIIQILDKDWSWIGEWFNMNKFEKWSQTILYKIEKYLD
jgi:hypothetical protein